LPDQIVTGIIGFGASGRYFHAPFLHVHPGFRVKSIVERTKREAESIYPEVKSVSDADELFSDPEIELIIITTPNDSHFELAYSALEAGKHVVVEKPFTTTSNEASELIRVGRASGKMLSVFQSRRFESDFLTIRKLLAEGRLGSVVEYESQFDRFRPNPNPKKWKEQNLLGIGLVYDLGSHLVDQALCLFGLPLSVDARIRSFRESSQVDDYFFIRLEYDSHFVYLRASSYVVKPGPRYIIHGKKGSFLKYGIDNQEEMLKQGYRPDAPGWGEEDPSQWGTLYTLEDGKESANKVPSEHGSYMLFYNNIFDVIRSQGELLVKPEEVYGVIRVIELAMESSRLAKAVTYKDNDEAP